MPNVFHPNLNCRLLGTDLLSTVLLHSKEEKSINFSYTPFGHSPVGKNTGFTGQFEEPGTGHYWLGNGYRAYNPKLIRFSKSDDLSPFGRGGLNSYSYCNGQPITQSDPSGRFALFKLMFYIQASAVMVGTAAVVAGISLLEGDRRDLSMSLMIGGGMLGVVGGIGVGAMMFKAARGSSRALSGLRSNGPRDPRYIITSRQHDRMNFFSVGERSRHTANLELAMQNEHAMTSARSSSVPAQRNDDPARYQYRNGGW